MYFSNISIAGTPVLDTYQPLDSTLHYADAHAEACLPQTKYLRYSLTRSLSHWHPDTIEWVSDEVLLKIFRYFLDVSPRDWPRLVHTCRKWRRIVFASQRVIRLRLFCTHGTPVQKSLDCWPAALPIVVHYGGSRELDPPDFKERENIMAALQQSDRVISIHLTISTWLLYELFAIKRAFSELQDLVLLSQEREPLTMPSTFRWGHRLRRLHSTGIALSAFLQPLYTTSSTDLIDLQLHDSFLPWDFPLAILKNALSEMTQLRSLSLHFLSTGYHFPLPPDGEPVVLPVLTRLDYRGVMAYLEGIVTIIDAPSLEEIEITSDNPFVAIPKFQNFIEMHRSRHGAHILSPEPTISIFFSPPGAPIRLELKSVHNPLHIQISSMAQICLDFSPFHFNDEEDLHIGRTRPSVRMDGSHVIGLLELLNKGKELFNLNMNHSLNIVHTLQALGSQHEKLPALPKLYIPQPWPRDAALREGVVSFMISRRLSGHPIEVEYERLSHINEHETGTSIIYSVPLSNPFVVGLFPRQLTIEVLSDDILLNIFRHSLDSDAAPRIWPTLVRVCRRWRQIVFASPLGLNLRLYCTHGTPVLKTLDLWPTFPVIVEYGGVPNLDPPAPEDDDNIIAALKHSGRVSSISLTVTSSLLEKLSTISEPFTELEEFFLCSQDNLQLTFPSSFHLGPRLRTVHLSRIAISSFPRLLLPSQFLVDIQLHDIPITGYLSPEAFATALSGTTQIRSLSLHFLSLPPRRIYLRLPPPPGERVILPALTYLKYRGTSKYLDSFAARIDAPHLGEINIIFFYQPTIDASQIGQFIERMEIHALLFDAEVETSADAISISFTDSSDCTPLRLQIPCKQLDWQLSCMAQVCDRISPFLSRVRSLRIDTAQPLGGRDDRNSEPWLDLLHSFKFSGVECFSVDSEVTTDILCVLGPANERNTTMLPSLRLLEVGGNIKMDGPSWDSVQSFITSRSISGRPVEVKAPSYQCHVCHGSSEDQLGLKRHLREFHGYQILCSYCAEFEWTPGQSDLFREHLEDKHCEVARSDAHISKPSLTIFQFDSLVNRHSTLRAPDVVPPSPMSDLVSDSSVSDSSISESTNSRYILTDFIVDSDDSD